MPKKKVSPKSLANLRPGIRRGQSQGKERLTLRVKPATKRWLETQRKIGDAIDKLVEKHQNQRSTGFMLGMIRLVNPWRGLVYVAEIETEHGWLSARTEDFKNFSIYSVQGGAEFYPGRKFERTELAQWLLGEPLHPDQRRVIVDEFGEIPAIAPNPQYWVWSAFRRGEERLKQNNKPTAAELQQLAGAALLLSPNRFLPLLDPWEIWVCDKDNQLPLMLAMTGQSLGDIDSATFSPLWRFNWRAATTETEPKLRALEKRVNERINAATEPGRVRWTHRLFRRNLDGSAEEWAGDPATPLRKVADHPAGWLPSGLLAEPFETERRLLEKR